ncbi:MAG: alpha/beta fold hydrolase [Acidobacteriota bacterium]|nr:alpha/beta fold hydrolase [Acidobacteriota bacterium]
MTTMILPGAEPLFVNQGPDGVLVLHGFTGNPTSMRALAEGFVDAGYSVSLPRLPGHGTSVEDMMTTNWADWSSAALAAYDELAATCARVVVVGLSMGGGLSAYVAERREVAGVVFINPIVKHPGSELADGIQQLIDGGMESFESIGSDIKKEGSVESSYSATPLRCVLSLFGGLDEDVTPGLATISAPALLFSSREDHVVTPDNGDLLVAQVTGPIERLWLEDSYHVATLDNDAALLERTALSFVAKVFAS